MKAPKLESFPWAWLALPAAFFLAQACGCGHVKAVETSLRVNTDGCKDAPKQPSDPDMAWIDCISGGEVSVRIELPRRAWHDMKKRPSPLEPAPGK